MITNKTEENVAIKDFNPKGRFLNRAKNYAKHRPDYPQKLINILEEEISFNNKMIIADVGYGTGNLTKLLLKNKNVVYGIEPNKEMRKWGEELLNKYKNFISVAGSAENTGLEEHSIDLITAAQSFHWFERDLTKKEFRRVLKNNGKVLLLWNERRIGRNTFTSEYENIILNYCTEYLDLNSKLDINKIVSNFFETDKFKKISINNYQSLDLDGIKGLLLSTSFIPINDEQKMSEIFYELEKVFNKYQIGGEVTIEYNTLLYIGELTY